MKWLKLIGLAALGLYLIICAVLFFAQRKLLYFPPSLYITPAGVDLDMEEVSLESGEDRLTAWYAPPSEKHQKTVMFFHGNGSAVYSNHDIFKDLIGQGYGVWSVGYPGYPGSSGTPSQAKMVMAASRQYEMLLARGVKPENIVFFGTSLGSGIAAQLTVQHKPALLIVDAPFNSILDMGRKQVPFLPVGLLMKDKFQSNLALSGADMPLIWTHGTADSVVPLSQGQKLYDSYAGPKSAHIIDGGQHTNLWGLGGREIVTEALRQIP